MSDRLQAEFARLLPMVDNAPSSNVVVLGHLMRQWLQDCIADAGTRVDSGAGFGAYDLHVKIDGEVVWVQLRKEQANG